jgi:hypothetical protein
MTLKYWALVYFQYVLFLAVMFLVATPVLTFFVQFLQVQ